MSTITGKDFERLIDVLEEQNKILQAQHEQLEGTAESLQDVLSVLNEMTGELRDGLANLLSL
jgi:ABC-type transporter Mla subunit MlaD